MPKAVLVLPEKKRTIGNSVDKLLMDAGWNDCLDEITMKSSEQSAASDVYREPLFHPMPG